jgi:hypothetical protein
LLHFAFFGAAGEFKSNPAEGSIPLDSPNPVINMAAVFGPEAGSNSDTATRRSEPMSGNELDPV